MWFWGRKEKKDSNNQVEKRNTENITELETASEIELEQAVSNSESTVELETELNETKVEQEKVKPENEELNQELVDLIGELKVETKEEVKAFDAEGYSKYQRKLRRVIKG